MAAGKVLAVETVEVVSLKSHYVILDSQNAEPDELLKMREKSLTGPEGLGSLDVFDKPQLFKGCTPVAYSKRGESSQLIVTEESYFREDRASGDILSSFQLTPKIFKNIDGKLHTLRSGLLYPFEHEMTDELYFVRASA
jgi:hypothetical protein